MPELQRLRADHAPAVLAFELANRAYFAAFVSDRGDEFHDQFTERHNALLAEQEAGICAFYLLVGEDGSVLGRFNLYDIDDGTAVLGYRVAGHVAGRGVATTAVRELCRLAAAHYGLRTLKAATTRENAASQKVLTKAGFVPVGPAEPGGKPGTWYQRDLAIADPVPGIHQEWHLPAFPALAAKDRQVHRACRIIVLQCQLPPGIRPRACTGIRYMVGSYDLGRHAATPLGATRLVRQRLSDQDKSRPFGLGFLDSSVSERQPLPWPGI